MKKERLISIAAGIIAVALATALFSCKVTTKYGPGPSKVANRPNIVLINVDDLGWSDLGCMGSDYYETPNIDRLSREGMLFRQAYAGASNCAPSRACMLSGLNTPRHGVYTVSPSTRGKSQDRKLIPVENSNFLPLEMYTFPEMLRTAGYVTACFGKWHIGENPADQGFDVHAAGNHMGNPGAQGYVAPFKIPGLEEAPAGAYLTDQLTDKALAFLDQYRDSTFFLYLPYYAVHTPIMSKPELQAAFSEKAGSKGHHRADYAGMIAAVDNNVGRLMDKLSELGLDRKTLVIFTSDNGGLCDVTKQYPLRAGKGTYYEGGIRVPLIVRWPDVIKSGYQADARVSQLDFYPTLQSLVQPARPAEQLDGQNILPLLQGKTLPQRDLYFHFPVYLEAGRDKEGLPDSLFRTRPGSVVISGDWKLHHYFEDNRLELYDLAGDPGENNNLATARSELVQSLYAKLDTWRKTTGAPIPEQLNPEYSGR